MRFKRSYLGIRGQLIAGIVVTTIAGIGLTGLLGIKIAENTAVYSRISEAGNITRIISTSVRQQPPGDAVRFIQSALMGAGIRDIRVRDVSGRIILSEGAVISEEGEVLFSDPALTVMRIGGGWFQGAGRALFISAPLGSGRERLGTLEFSVPLSEIQKSMAGVRRFFVVYALLDSIIIIGLGIYFLSRSVIGPVRKLDEAAKRISGGKLGERAEVTADNELGSLSRSFNSMAGRLEEEIKSLERLNLELLAAQEELTRASTLAAVGRLASGIAHEIGNPLGAVKGYLDILFKGVADKAQEAEIIERASREAARIDSIVREFLDVARPAPRPDEPVDVNPVLLGAISAASVMAEFSSVDIRKDFATGIPPVMVEDGKLRQVFMNILVNAAHSFEGCKGTRLITVETGTQKRPYERGVRRRRDDAPVVPESGAFSDRERLYVTVRFTDNGCGIDAITAGRVFEPFFTTKGPGRGTGLGLFVSQSIIKAYGGEIALASTDGAGSVFTVILPCADGVLDR